MNLTSLLGTETYPQNDSCSGVLLIFTQTLSWDRPQTLSAGPKRFRSGGIQRNSSGLPISSAFLFHFQRRLPTIPGWKTSPETGGTRISKELAFCFRVYELAGIIFLR